MPKRTIHHVLCNSSHRSFSVAQKTNTTQLGKLRINTHSGRRENWIERNQKHCHCDKKAHRVQGVWFLGKLVGKKEKLQTAPYRLCKVENPDNIKLSNGKDKCDSEGEEETKIGTEISFDSPILKKRNKQSSVVKW